jgi:hypothetical protein
MIAPDVAAFDATVTTRAPAVPWYTPLRVVELAPPPPLESWRCRLCYARVGVVDFRTWAACVEHLLLVHGRAMP